MDDSEYQGEFKLTLGAFRSILDRITSGERIQPGEAVDLLEHLRKMLAQDLAAQISKTFGAVMNEYGE